MDPHPLDPQQEKPPGVPGRGCNPLFFLILFLIVAALAWIAWDRLPADISPPWGSGVPSGPPPGNSG